MAKFTEKDNKLLVAKLEIHETLFFCDFCTRKLGISFIDDAPLTTLHTICTYFLHIFTCSSVTGLLLAETYYVFLLVLNTSSLDQFISGLHILGYGIMSLAKMLTLWYKRSLFRQRVSELAEIWPVQLQDKESDEIKNASLSALKLGQLCYFLCNFLGLLFYIVTPVFVYIYKHAQGVPEEFGNVWHAAYPFDKSEPLNHAIVFVFESITGVFCVSSMLGSDLMFCTMASHISMVLRLLQLKIRNVVPAKGNQITNDNNDVDCYKAITSLIKVHQRLINYSRDLEDTFSLVNLINVVLSSVDICCVVFTIGLLEPWMEMSNKLFLGAALTQVGILCWYADDIYRASLGVADAVYECRWYETNIRCRRALLVLIQRSQKPLYFTALKFHSITLATYGSILRTAYSYFTLLCTSYKQN